MGTVRNALKQMIPTGLWAGGRAMYHKLRQVGDPELRYNFWGKFNPKIHQTTAYTASNRYPNAFSTVRELMATQPDLKILSFGCSTGEEVVSLKTYFPSASIVGAELNENRLQQCRQKINDASVTFIKSTDSNIQRYAPYDAIFAMAVLQRTPHKVDREGITNLTSIYKFSMFEDQVKKFDANLTVGGLIIIQNTQYRFKDTEIADRFEVCGHALPEEIHSIFDQNGDLVTDEQYDEIIFRKIR